eukprot:TRINITY_DN5470_c0_g1_i1.p2 TRINITY_DN5470_c0_g1~~TRINITY_DN5470_c0_g1_i1.p2  ORF type:complete len:104 (+),score=44.96 TRINITY_DN5470_c0_g1_i1:69-380(+)
MALQRRLSETMTANMSTPSIDDEFRALFPEIEARIAPCPFAPGDEVEVQRSDGSWQVAQIKRMLGEYFYVAWFDPSGDLMKKQVHITVANQLLRPRTQYARRE